MRPRALGSAACVMHTPEKSRCESGETGRRAGFRILCLKRRGGSTPPSRTLEGRLGNAVNDGFPSLLRFPKPKAQSSLSQEAFSGETPYPVARTDSLRCEDGCAETNRSPERSIPTGWLRDPQRMAALRKPRGGCSCKSGRGASRPVSSFLQRTPRRSCALPLQKQGTGCGASWGVATVLQRSIQESSRTW